MNETVLRIIVGAVSCIGVVLTGFFMHKKCMPLIKAVHPDFELPDLKWHYSPDQLSACFEAIGADGRKALKRLYLIDYGFMLSLLPGLVIIGYNTAVFPWVRAAMTVFAALRTLADLMENTLLLHAIKQHPAQGIAAKAASVLTPVKWVLSGCFVVLMFFGLIFQASKL